MLISTIVTLATCLVEALQQDLAAQGWTAEKIAEQVARIENGDLTSVLVSEPEYLLTQ